MILSLNPNSREQGAVAKGYLEEALRLLLVTLEKVVHEKLIGQEVVDGGGI